MSVECLSNEIGYGIKIRISREAGNIVIRSLQDNQAFGFIRRVIKSAALRNGNDVVMRPMSYQHGTMYGSQLASRVKAVGRERRQPSRRPGQHDSSHIAR